MADIEQRLQKLENKLQELEEGLEEVKNAADFTVSEITVGSVSEALSELRERLAKLGG